MSSENDLKPDGTEEVYSKVNPAPLSGESESTDRKKGKKKGTPVSEMTPEEKKAYNRKQWIITIAELAVVAVLVFQFTRFVACRSVVQGSSMHPALEDGDNLIVERISYYAHDPERFDIVVFHSPVEDDSKEYYIKRIIGLPCETVEIREGEAYINGVLLEADTYGADKMKNLFDDTLQNYGPVTVPDGCIFVLGDNREVSIDSRDPSVGTVPIKKVTGKALVRLWPFNEIGKVK